MYYLSKDAGWLRDVLELLSVQELYAFIYCLSRRRVQCHLTSSITALK